MNERKVESAFERVKSLLKKPVTYIMFVTSLIKFYLKTKIQKLKEIFLFIRLEIREKFLSLLPPRFFIHFRRQNCVCDLKSNDQL